MNFFRRIGYLSVINGLEANTLDISTFLKGNHPHTTFHKFNFTFRSAQSNTITSKSQGNFTCRVSHIIFQSYQHFNRAFETFLPFALDFFHLQAICTLHVCILIGGLKFFYTISVKARLLGTAQESPKLHFHNKIF